MLKGPIEVEFKDLSIEKTQAKGNRIVGVRRIFDENKVFQNATAIGKGISYEIAQLGNVHQYILKCPMTFFENCLRNT